MTNDGFLLSFAWLILRPEPEVVQVEVNDIIVPETSRGSEETDVIHDSAVFLRHTDVQLALIPLDLFPAIGRFIPVQNSDEGGIGANELAIDGRMPGGSTANLKAELSIR